MSRLTVRAAWAALALAVPAALFLASVAVSTAMTCTGAPQVAGLFDGIASLFSPTSSAVCSPSSSATWIVFVLSVAVAGIAVLTVLSRLGRSNTEAAQ